MQIKEVGLRENADERSWIVEKADERIWIMGECK